MSQQKTIWIAAAAPTPIGPIWLALSERGLVAVSLWDDEANFRARVAQLTGGEVVRDEVKTEDAAAQIIAYLNGSRHTFDLPIDWSVLSTAQAEILRLVHAIPYGEKRTYGDIARELGKPGAARAVGRANATNPMPLVIPCHRVLGSDGKLHGFSAPGGLETKAWLLRLEGSWLL
jgi:methylated-DNA-[protein]-cysteine S-methyltransferase